MFGEHFGFQLLMFLVLIGSFTVVSLVPLLGSPKRAQEESED